MTTYTELQQKTVVKIYEEVEDTPFARMEFDGDKLPDSWVFAAQGAERKEFWENYNLETRRMASDVKRTIGNMGNTSQNWLEMEKMAKNIRIRLQDFEDDALPIVRLTPLAVQLARILLELDKS